MSKELHSVRPGLAALFEKRQDRSAENNAACRFRGVYLVSRLCGWREIFGHRRDYADFDQTIDLARV